MQRDGQFAVAASVQNGALTYSTISYQSQQPYIASVLSPVHPFPVYVPYATPLLFAGNNGNLAFYSSDSGVLQLTPH